MVKAQKYPEVGEFVVCTVRTVKGYGAFVLLEEYPGKEGFIHIAEIAHGWIKHIRDHVRERQKVVCKVIRVNPEKGHIDLSLKQVNDHQKREKIKQWMSEQKAEKLFEIVCSRAGLDYEGTLEKVGPKLTERFGSLYTAFETVTIDPDAISDMKGKWIKPFIEVAKENIVPPYVVIEGIMKLRTTEPKGVEDIKDTVRYAMDVDLPKGVDVNIKYTGSPKYRITIRGPDYKTAESVMKHVVSKAEERFKELKGEFEFIRKEGK